MPHPVSILMAVFWVNLSFAVPFILLSTCTTRAPLEIGGIVFLQANKLPVIQPTVPKQRNYETKGH